MNTYHRIYAEVDLGAIKYNITNIKETVGHSVAIMPVVKADAYGHGAAEVSKVLYDFASLYGVATIEEAVELRGCGIDKPILILGTLSSRHFEEAVKNDITVNVYTDEMARLLSDVAVSLKKDVCVHLAVDTGMNRIGMRCDEEGLLVAKKIVSYPNLNVCGIFSHYATADEADKATAYLQKERFDTFCQRLLDEGIQIEHKHICNSAAVCDMSDECYTMVRPGIIIYGLYPSDEVSMELSLKPALQLKSHVSYIKKVPAGEGISYGHTHVTDSQRVIATVPVGYADGYPRALSGKGRVLVGGRYAPIVGRVCMDQFMIDITDIPGVKIEDTVTLIGTDGKNSVTADEIAKICDTINYEIVCGIGKRVPRIYK